MIVLDLNKFYSTITDNVPNYIIFVVLLLFMYLLVVTSFKILCDNIIKVVLAVRAPVSFKIQDQEKN